MTYAVNYTILETIEANSLKEAEEKAQGLLELMNDDGWYPNEFDVTEMR